MDSSLKQGFQKIQEKIKKDCRALTKKTNELFYNLAKEKGNIQMMVSLYESDSSERRRKGIIEHIKDNMPDDQNNILDDQTRLQILFRLYSSEPLPRLKKLLHKDILILVSEIESIQELIFYWQRTNNHDLRNLLFERIKEVAISLLEIDDKTLEMFLLIFEVQGKK